jgi:CRP-like cAMP-binding protein
MHADPEPSDSTPLAPSPAGADGVSQAFPETDSARDFTRLLASHPFLRDLAPEHLQHLAVNAVSVRCRAEEFLFREGEPANRFYLIQSGCVALEAHLRDEAPVEVQRLGAGEVIGWSWLFPPCHWNFDARALEPVTAISFYGTRLRDQCDQDHHFGYEIMRRMTHVVIDRLQATRRQLLECRR